MKKISLKAILAGTITHYLLGYLLLIIPIIYVLLPLQSQEIGFEQLGNVLFRAIEGSAKLPLLQALAQLISALIAGYVGARIAERNELLNSCLAALPCNALATYRLLTRPHGLVAGVDFVLIVAAMACALLGGLLAIARRHMKIKSTAASR